MKQKQYKSILAAITLALLGFAGVASAHVVVKPATVGIGAFQVFTMGVPSEKNIATTSVRLMLPDGLKFVTPNVKAGWKVVVKKQATGRKIMDDDGMQMDEMKLTEIDWAGGSIPAGQRDEFSFQAQVPTIATSLPWKAYQTYQDGSVVSWDQTPSSTSKNPYSMTSIVDDLAPAPSKISWWATNQINISLGISLLALITSLVILIKHKQ